MDVEERQRLETLCLARLEALGIDATTHHHPPVYTVEESRALRGEIKGAHVKNLFLCDRKKRRFWLLTARESTAIGLKVLGQQLHASGLRFANAQHLADKLGVEPGSVTPLAIINDDALEVEMVFEADLLNEEYIAAHPLHNAATTVLKTADLMRLFEACEHEPLLLELKT